MRAVLLGLALVGLASWSAHQTPGPSGADIAAAIRAEAAAEPKLQAGGCLTHDEFGYAVVKCGSAHASLRALRTTTKTNGADCPQTTTSLIKVTHRLSQTTSYWCTADLPKVGKSTPRK